VSSAGRRCPIEVSVSSSNQPSPGVGAIGAAEAVQNCQPAPWFHLEYRARVIRPAQIGSPIEVSVGAKHQPRPRCGAVNATGKAMQRGQLAGWGELEHRAVVLGTSSSVRCPVEIPVRSLDNGSGPIAVVPVETEQ